MNVSQITDPSTQTTGPRKSLVRRTLISITLIGMAMMTSIAAFETMRRGKPQVAAREVTEAVYNVDVFEVSPLSFTELVKAFGTARADREVVLAAQVSGEIIEVHPSLRAGLTVSPGRGDRTAEGLSAQVDPDILLRIDPRDYEQQVQQSEASIATLQTEIQQLKQQQQNSVRQLKLAEQDLKTLREDYERVRALRERGAGSATDLMRSLLELRRYEDAIVQLENQITLLPHQISSAEQRLTGTRSDLQRAGNDLKRTMVTAPFRGVVAEVMVEQGQYIRAGEPLLRLIDPEKIEIPASIGFEDYLLIQKAVLGREFPTASLALNETSKARWTGRIVRVAPSADIQSRTIEVYIEVINSEQTEPLLPGTFVFASIEGPRYQQALLVPREAVVDGAVFTVDTEQRAARHLVKSGRRLQSLIVVEDGLNSGDRVILTNLDVIRQGTRVDVQRVISASEEIGRMRSPVVRLSNP